VPYHGYFWLDSLLRKLFGKQEGEKLSNAIGVLAGVAGLVVSIANQWSWFAVVSAEEPPGAKGGDGGAVMSSVASTSPST